MTPILQYHLFAFLLMSGSFLPGQDPPSIAQARKILEKTPDDPKANTTLGLYLGAVENNWTTALPLLQKAQNAIYSSAAKRELEATDNAFDWVEIGDLWLNASQKSKDARAGLNPKETDASSVKTEFLPIPPGAKVKVTAWVFTDGNSGDGDDFAFSFVSEANRPLGGGLLTPVKSDRPFWTKLEMEGIAPEKTVNGNILIVFKSQKGTMFVDDCSVTVNGKEILTSPSFE